MSKFALMSAFMNGTPLTVGGVTGTVIGISLESGFTHPDTPHHFNVHMSTPDPTRPGHLKGVQKYVKTVD